MFLSFSAVCFLFAGCGYFPFLKGINPFTRQNGIKLNANEFQLELMHLADGYITMLEKSADILAFNSSSLQERVTIYERTMALVQSALAIAVEPNPVEGAMDMAVLTSLSRLEFQDNWQQRFSGQFVQTVAERYKKYENDGWGLVSKVLLPEQQEELKRLIWQWREENPGKQSVAFVRLRGLEDDGSTHLQAKAPESVFNLLLIDPFAGLRPATREIAKTRQTTERMMWQAQRWPKLAGLQLKIVLVRAQTGAAELAENLFRRAMVLVGVVLFGSMIVGAVLIMLRIRLSVPRR